MWFIKDALVVLGVTLLCVVAFALLLAIPAALLWSCLWAWNCFPHSDSPTTWADVALWAVIAFALCGVSVRWGSSRSADTEPKP